MLTIFWIIGSIIDSTLLILINKQVLSVYSFGCPTFLTTFHFILTFGWIDFMGKMKWFEVNDKLPDFDKWYMGFMGVLSIVAMNLNIKLNSVGFYQLSKLCTIPFMVLYKLVFQGQRTPFNILCSIVVLMVGLCLFTVNDVQFNLIGSIVALVAVISTVLYQTQTQSYQKQYQISGTQLNHNIGIPQISIGLVASFLLETHGKNSIYNHDFKRKEVILIICTGFLAILGNIIAFNLIGKAGPITYQVVGHVKTIMIFVFGLIFFPPSQSETKEQKIKKIVGLCIAMCGVILYTVFEMTNKDKESEAQLLPKKDEEDNLESIDTQLNTQDAVFLEANNSNKSDDEDENL